MAAEVTGSSSGEAISMWVLPHRSLTGAGLVAFLVAQGFAAGLLAGLAAWAGNVLAPAFAVLELGVLAYCLRRVWCASGFGQLIVLSATELSVTSARNAATARFHPYWVRVELEPGRERGWPSRLVLRSHGRALEIGAFLNDDERRELAQRLTELLRPLKDGGGSTGISA